MDKLGVAAWIANQVGEEIVLAGGDATFVEAAIGYQGTMVLLDTGHQVFRIDISEVGEEHRKMADGTK